VSSQADAPNPSLIPETDAVGVTVLLITCTYHGQEFIRVGYYVNNEYPSPELRENPPPKPDFSQVRSICTPGQFLCTGGPGYFWRPKLLGSCSAGLAWDRELLLRGVPYRIRSRKVLLLNHVHSCPLGLPTCSVVFMKQAKALPGLMVEVGGGWVLSPG
jgi:hypothetical protein